jgi:hypothetical protein
MHGGKDALASFQDGEGFLTGVGHFIGFATLFEKWAPVRPMPAQGWDDGL